MGIEEKYFYDHLNQIIDNTYQILVKKRNIEDILDDENRIPMFLFDPSEGYPSFNEGVYELLIEHYEEEEEYEKCQALLEAMKRDQHTE
jgi:hypothetical protein|tara:strand:- start:1224 stop:1490 length:267 start_codon:yes stop_codon:yes gene_type:complete